MQSGQVVAQSACDTVQTMNLLPVQVAGAPMAAKVVKCQLKPLRESEYLQSGAVFTQAQLTRLGATFPQGICDWTKKGVGQQPPKGDWLDYTSVVGGRRLGPAPVSTLVARRG